MVNPVNPGVPTGGPLRTTVKENTVAPELPSGWLGAPALIDNEALVVSSSGIAPTARAPAMLTPPGASTSVTAQLSFGSLARSPAAVKLMVCCVWPSAKTTRPPGSTPPTKSSAVAAMVPGSASPVTAHRAKAGPTLLPLRVTVKTWVAPAPVPSAPPAAFAAIVSTVSCSAVDVRIDQAAIEPRNLRPHLCGRWRSARLLRRVTRGGAPPPGPLRRRLAPPSTPGHTSRTHRAAVVSRRLHAG